jgi:hypothetical protein
LTYLERVQAGDPVLVQLAAAPGRSGGGDKGVWSRAEVLEVFNNQVITNSFFMYGTYIISTALLLRIWIRVVTKFCDRK